MTNLAFLLNFPKEYKGGINYIKNLLFAISQVKNDFKIFLFVPENIEVEYIEIFSPYAVIIKTKILNRNTPLWFIEKVIEKLFKRNYFILRLLRNFDIKIVSHSNFFSTDKSIKTINWIPDFQCLHYPDLWSKKDLNATLQLYKRIVKNSDRIIVSSNDAYKDLANFAPHAKEKSRVLQFVSQPNLSKNLDLPQDSTMAKLKTYNINRAFFYVPNQFWAHKNHIVVFEAVKILKSKGLNPLLVTTGLMFDYRTNNKTYNSLNNFISDEGLKDNILLLGLIPYSDVLMLFKEAKAIINPSLFEGWSSSVEESKSLGKTIVLSDIPIHKEQNPSKGIYFDPYNANELSDILVDVLESDDHIKEETEVLKLDLLKRTNSFGNKYLDILSELI